MDDCHANVLLIEDNPGDVLLLRASLDEVGGDPFTVIHVDHLAAGLRRLAEDGIDIVLQDLTLPDGNGLEILRTLRRQAATVPIVVLTGRDDEALALQAVQEGAQDYLVKGSMNGHALARCIRYAIERERLRTELEEARDQALEAARLKSEFLANISHELRTPLTAILGFSSLLRRNHHGTCDVRQLNHLERIHQNGQHLLAMINDLLDLSKIEAGKVSISPEQVHPGAVIAQVVDTLLPLAANQDIDLEEIVADGLPTFHSDPIRLHQVLLNLGSNAIKFTHHGGVILEARQEGDTMVFQVRDTGIGIPAEALETIFDEFRQVDGSMTREYSGTGLGLSVSRQLARLLGGDIEVFSREGEGSTFTLRLPLAGAKPTAATPAAQRLQVPV